MNTIAYSMKNSYWGNNGLHQSVIDRLQALIPESGPVEKVWKNAALEKFRKASNCYYDLYNNGLCNRARSFARVFGIAAGDYRTRGYDYSERLYALTELKMNEIVAAAAAEQGIDREVAVS